MNSYQKKKQAIQYLDQRGEDLEEIIFDLARRMKKAGIPLPLLVGRGMTGDRFINDIHSGDFGLRVRQEYEKET